MLITTRDMAVATYTAPKVAALGAGLVPAEHLLSDSTIDQSKLSGASLSTNSDNRSGRLNDETFKEGARRLLTADPKARIVRDDNSNAATFISGDFAVSVQPGVGGSGPDRIARTFLVKNGAAFGITDQATQLQLMGIERDDLGFRHYKYQQYNQGLPVFGQQLIVHAQDDRVTSVGGRITPNIASAQPHINGSEAQQRAVGSMVTALTTDGARNPNVKTIGAEQLGWFTLENGTPRLAYELIVGSGGDKRWQMYVDAETGEVLDRWSLIHSAMIRETVDVKSGKVLREGSQLSGDKALDAAHVNAKDVYEYFHSKHGRDSIDGRGMKLRSNVHYGNKYNNAFWNGTSMTYGDGDGVRFLPFSLAPDVVAHEMMHGITERTAGLRYFRQSGALNESWSDVFGNLVEKWGERRNSQPESDPKWLVGEDIFTPGIEGDGLRSMSNPGTGYDNDPQPGHMRDYKETNSDNGGVHINSGIPNKAAYEIAMAIGQDKLSNIWYRTLTNYMTSTSQFRDASNMTVQAAIDLYGNGSSEAKAVAKAWDSVGLTPQLSPGFS